MIPSERYAVYGYNTNNIGDDVQSIASMRFLPRVDFVIDREKIHSFQGPRAKAFLNAFYIDSTKHFPPPLGEHRPFVDFHACDTG